MRYTLIIKTMCSLLLVTSVILISHAEAGTTLGQEEDVFSKIWSHSPDEKLKSMKLEKADKRKLGESYIKNDSRDVAHPLKERTSDKQRTEMREMLLAPEHNILNSF